MLRPLVIRSEQHHAAVAIPVWFVSPVRKDCVVRPGLPVAKGIDQSPLPPDDGTTYLDRVSDRIRWLGGAADDLHRLSRIKPPVARLSATRRACSESAARHRRPVPWAHHAVMARRHDGEVDQGALSSSARLGISKLLRLAALLGKASKSLPQHAMRLLHSQSSAARAERYPKSCGGVSAVAGGRDWWKRNTLCGS
jgi:hypothetical protein